MTDRECFEAKCFEEMREIAYADIPHDEKELRLSAVFKLANRLLDYAEGKKTE